jgi:hypothetical protein
MIKTATDVATRVAQARPQVQDEAEVKKVYF